MYSTIQYSVHLYYVKHYQPPQYSSEGSGDDSDSALLRPGDSDSDEEDSDDDDNASLASSIAELSSG